MIDLQIRLSVTDCVASSGTRTCHTLSLVMAKQPPNGTRASFPAVPCAHSSAPQLLRMRLQQENTNGICGIVLALSHRSRLSVVDTKQAKRYRHGTKFLHRPTTVPAYRWFVSIRASNHPSRQWVRFSSCRSQDGYRSELRCNTTILLTQQCFFGAAPGCRPAPFRLGPFSDVNFYGAITDLLVISSVEML